jgi:hypothetical protein
MGKTSLGWPLTSFNRVGQARHFSENFLFSKLNDLILHPSRPVASTFLQSKGRRAIWQTAVRLPEAGNRHFDPFPWQILGHLDLSLADS